jgi:ankyrin repeat protein
MHALLYMCVHLLQMSDKMLITSLLEAIQQGDLALVQQLIMQQSNNEAVGAAARMPITASGATALHIAAQQGDLAIVEWLVQHGGADVAAVTTENGSTALHLAAAAGQLAVIKWLVQHGGADVAAVDVDGFTALHSAAWPGHLAVIKWLVQHGGADVSYLDANGLTALDMMCQMQRSNLLEGVRLLAEHLALKSPPLAAQVCERLPAQCREAAVSAVASSYKDLTERFAAYMQGEGDRKWEAQCFYVQAAAALRQSNQPMSSRPRRDGST